MGFCPIIQRTEGSRERAVNFMGAGVCRPWTVMSTQLEYLGLGKNRSGQGHVSCKKNNGDFTFFHVHDVSHYCI